MLQPHAGAGVTVRTSISPPTCPDLLADRRQLETALLNLAANAREAMDGAGVLTLTARRDTAAQAEASRYRRQPAAGRLRAASRCADTGRGMDAEVRARAVEPFFSTKPRGQGAGLGLSMARGFAEQSGGALADRQRARPRRRDRAVAAGRAA